MSFADDLRAVLLGVRGALTEALLDAGANPERPPDIAKKLGLHRNLAWKVSRVATEREVLMTLDHLPGAPGCQSIVTAIAKGAKRPERAQALREALDRFDRFVDERAGDRQTLQLMFIELLPRHAARERHELARRAAFEGNRALWGVQARLRSACTIVAPSDDGIHVDVAFIGGIFGLASLRSNVSMPLFRMANYLPDGTRSPTQPQPVIPPPPEDGGMPILRDFCSSNLPTMSVLQDEGRMVYQVPLSSLGCRHAVDCVYATMSRKMQTIRSQPDESEARYAFGCMSPCELLLCDLLVARSLPWALPPTAELSSRLYGHAVTPEAIEKGRLPFFDDVEHLGTPPTLATPAWARYPAAVATVMDRLAWKLADFTGFRVVMPVPPIPTQLVLRHPLAG